MRSIMLAVKNNTKQYQIDTDENKGRYRNGFSAGNCVTQVFPLSRLTLTILQFRLPLWLSAILLLLHSMIYC